MNNTHRHTQLNSEAKSVSIIHLVLDSGERLPCLVDTQTWLPLRLATRWAVRYRRYRVQANTLISNLRMVGQIYTWAWEIAALDLDDYLTSGQLFNTRQIESLAACLREASQRQSAAVISPTTYNARLAVAEEFLTWALYPENRGGKSHLSLTQLNDERTHLRNLLRSLRISGRNAQRIQPLTDEEIDSVRKVIGPLQTAAGNWTFPPGGFSPQTALRNWLMFETALELGLRRGELLKLRLDSLPRGSETGITIRRLPDDPGDSRALEPAVKTSERCLPASRHLLRLMRVYVTQPPPLGRLASPTPYLFVTRSGDPVSSATANDIIKAIGKRSGVESLSWHRLRHTWAEKMAQLLHEEPNGHDQLMYLGGWTNPESPRRYIQNVIARQAMATLHTYQSAIYANEDGAKLQEEA